MYPSKTSYLRFTVKLTILLYVSMYTVNSVGHACHTMHIYLIVMFYAISYVV